jgi:hypothetical protein
MSDLEPPTFRVTMLLADAAQVSDGKLHVLGGGLRVVGPNPQPASIALLVEVPWDQANMRHEWKLELLSEDGMPVMHGDRPVIVGGEFEAGRPAGLTPGSSLIVPMAINFSAVPARAGAAYTWRLAIDGTSEPDWRLSFTVRPPKPQTA